MVHCVVNGCSNQATNLIALHNFPKDPSLLRLREKLLIAQEYGQKVHLLAKLVVLYRVLFLSKIKFIQQNEFEPSSL